MIIKIKRLFTIFASLLLSVYTTTLAKGHYGWCSPYDTFCLFSEGIETRVSNLSEAQFKCSEIKNASWPVELGNERVKEVFIEFIHNYSISNVILNAYNRNGKWYWIKSNTSVQIIFNVKDSIIFYNNSGFYSDYSVVCMTDCLANWTDINETQSMQPDAYYHLGIKTSEECKEFCEINITCSSIEWTYGSQFHGCWIHKYPYDASKLNSNDKSSHHVIDRTVKSVKRCINEAFSFSRESRQNESRNESPKESQYKSTANLVEILVPIILIVSILVIVILIIIFYKRKIKKAETSDDFGAYKENEVNSQQDGNQTPHEKINIYENAEEINKEPNRYPGPRGDQYTEVDIDDKQSSADRNYKTTENILNFQSQQEESQTSHKKITTYDNVKAINEEPNRYPGPRGDQYTEVDIDGKLR